MLSKEQIQLDLSGLVVHGVVRHVRGSASVDARRQESDGHPGEDDKEDRRQI